MWLRASTEQCIGQLRWAAGEHAGRLQALRQLTGARSTQHRQAAGTARGHEVGRHGRGATHVRPAFAATMLEPLPAWISMDGQSVECSSCACLAVRARHTDCMTSLDRVHWCSSASTITLAAQPWSSGPPAPTFGCTLPSPVCALLLTTLGLTVVVGPAMLQAGVGVVWGHGFPGAGNQEGNRHMHCRPSCPAAAAHTMPQSKVACFSAPQIRAASTQLGLHCCDSATLTLERDAS